MRAILAIVLFAASVAAHAQQYQLRDLGALPGGKPAIGIGLNESGQVTGTSEDASGATSTFLYENGSMKNIGPAGVNSSAAGINNSGQIVGNWTSRSGRGTFLYSNGVVQELGNFGGSSTLTHDINDSGQIVGEYGVDRGAFLYSNGSVQDLGTLGGREGGAFDINNRGQIVGSSAYTMAHGSRHAFLYENGSMRDLGTLAGAYSEATAINDNGQIVGISETSRGGAVNHAFLYENGSMKDLGTLPGGDGRPGEFVLDGSIALAINSLGQVTGSSYSSQGYRAFLYSGGQMLDLNSLLDPSSPLALYVRLTDAIAITDSGLILAHGLDSRTPYVGHTYILNPVPLPAAGWLLFSGLSGLLVGARRLRV